MPKDNEKKPKDGKRVPLRQAESRKIASDGIKTSRDFAKVMSTLMGDLLSGAVEPRVANAVCNAGGKLLRMVELQHKYGKRLAEEEEHVLALVS